MGLYSVFKAQQVSWDDPDSAMTEEYDGSVHLSARKDIRETHGNGLFPLILLDSVRS